MKFCFDIDGTICSQKPDNQAAYNEAKPFKDVIKEINRLYKDGHTIIFLTARGSTTGIDWKDFTTEQLRKWGVKYHELHFGKPNADVFIDDKARTLEDAIDLSSRNYRIL
uniref:Putative haloacid dehalogenase-like hydrolase n=1 Tax=viral metagenome TaxID=1070528 RepID=A0A6M3LGH3_9ZZZZ